eukprot:Rhum_TRINITY_DN14248_c0_g1::Rhum_TRINITY_DN14248_c0_g1_i1::g.73495::m.73495
MPRSLLVLALLGPFVDTAHGCHLDTTLKACNNIGTVSNSASPDACEATCKAAMACMTWVYRTSKKCEMCSNTQLYTTTATDIVYVGPKVCPAENVRSCRTVGVLRACWDSGPGYIDGLSTPDECQVACQNQAGCQLWSWVPHGGTRCHLCTGQTLGTVPSDHTNIAGPVYCLDSDPECGYIGYETCSDLGVLINEARPDNCLAQCQATPTCKSWSWRPHGNKDCKMCSSDTFTAQTADMTVITGLADCASGCKGYTCSAGWEDKGDKGLLTCTGACDDATCCQITTSCSTFTCGTGYNDKAMKAQLPCLGSPVVVCDVATCCDVIQCDTHTCAGNFQDKAMKATIDCVGTPPTCDDATCCDVNTCQIHICSSMFQDKAMKATIS